MSNDNAPTSSSAGVHHTKHDGVTTALDDTSKFIAHRNTEPAAPAHAGIERLLRATAHLIENEENDSMKVAVRIAVEQLHRKDSALRRECLTFAADQLADARARWRVHNAQDEILIDLLRAACLARTGRETDAQALVADARARAQTVIARRDDELARLDTSGEPAALRASSLRNEPVLALADLEVIAVDVQRADG